MLLVSGIFIGLAIGVVIGVPLVRFELKRQTDRARAAEGRAHAAQRLAEIGAMTGGLAHEIKNPLSTIGLNAQLLSESVQELAVDDLEKGRLVRRLDILRREVERLRDTLADFLKFAGEVRVEPKPTDLNSVVEELVDFYTPQAQHRGVSLRTDLSKQPLTVMLDTSHFKQALLNLLLNATQAMSPPGSDGAPAAKDLILRTNPGKGPDGPTCELHVIDTGPGIPPEMIEKIFTPYFTTKSGGTGLGLPTTRRLIEAHGGRLSVHSEVGRGTDFAIVLPRVA
ncbi:MAG: two-component sensor histidine kinase [Phycisphaerae bacterium]|nr:two-component sensor histidine kinase [Phycisphaerae bacterium]